MRRVDRIALVGPEDFAMNDRVHLAGHSPLIFAGSPLDRGDAVRRDLAKLEALANHENAQCIMLCNGSPAMNEKNLLVRHTMADTQSWQATGPLVYLGSGQRGPVFAGELIEGTQDPAGATFTDPRQAATLLPHDEAAIFAQAKALFAWRARHKFCANCGSPTHQSAGGAKRVCHDCEAEHFPRVDPVVIMLATHGDRCLLGRQSGWPDGIWSALAGFVEPAETLEEACARELHEEAGVVADIAAIRYVMTQPWPMPHSLMVGLVAPVHDTELTIDAHELEQAKWFTRTEVISMLDGTHAEAVMPPSIAIARRLAELWVADKI
jgi:NAD+ diphosphatase